MAPPPSKLPTPSASSSSPKAPYSPVVTSPRTAAAAQRQFQATSSPGQRYSLASSPSSSPMSSYKSNSSTGATVASSSTASTSSSLPLPSIRSLKSKFQSLTGGSKRASTTTVISGPKVVFGQGGAAEQTSGKNDGPAPGMARAKSAGSIPRPQQSSSSPSLSGRRPSSADAKSKLPRFGAAKSPPSSPSGSPRISSPLEARDYGVHTVPLMRRMNDVSEEDPSVVGQDSNRSMSTTPPFAAASDSAKAGYRISSDFMRPANEPPLAQLRANRNSLLGKRGVGRPTSTQSTQSGQTSTPTSTTFPAGVNSQGQATQDSASSSPNIGQSAQSSPSRLPTPGSASRAQFSSIIIAPKDPSTDDHVLPGLKAKESRPFSPSPVPPPATITTVQQQQPLNTAALRNDMAYRRLSLSPSPVLGPSHSPPMTSRGFSPKPQDSLAAAPSGTSEKYDEPESSREPLGLGVSHIYDSNMSISSMNRSRNSSPSIYSSAPQPSSASLSSQRVSVGSANAVSHKASALSLSNPSPTPSAIESFAAIPHPTSQPGLPETPPRVTGKRDRQMSHDDPEASTTSLLLDDDGGHQRTGERGVEDAEATPPARNRSAASTTTTTTSSFGGDRRSSGTSGNTFGDQAPEKTAEEPERPQTKVREAGSWWSRREAAVLPPAAITPTQASYPERHATTSPDPTMLRRSRSALDNVRQGLSSSALRRVETGSPILVAGGDAHVASLYRSQSARSPPQGSTPGISLHPATSPRDLGSDGTETSLTLKERRQVARNRKTKSDSFNIGEDGADVPEDRILTSPLDELIAGLGGRRASGVSGASGEDDGRLQKVSSLSLRDAHPLGVTSENPEVDLAAPVKPLTISPHASKSQLRSTPFANAPTEEEVTAERIEREIARMETEMLLSGSPRRARGAQNGLLDSGASASSSLLDRPSSAASSLPDGSSIRTARSWSIAEVDRAYERMKQMLGSTRSNAYDDTLTLAGSEMGDNEVEQLFESALQTRAAAEASLDETPRLGTGKLQRTASGLSLVQVPLSEHSSSQLETLSVPPNTRDTPSPSNTMSGARPTSLQPAFVPSSPKSDAQSSRRNTLDARPPATSESGRVRGATSSESLSDASRPVHQAAPMMRRNSDSSILSAVSLPTAIAGAAAATPTSAATSRAVRRRSNPVTTARSSGASSTSAAPDRHPLLHSRTNESLQSYATTTTEGGATGASESEGWATPLTSPGIVGASAGRRPRSRLSGQLRLKSGAGREWAQQGLGEVAGLAQPLQRPPSNSGSQSTQQQPSIGDDTDAESETSHHYLVNKRQRHVSGSDKAPTPTTPASVAALGNDRWFTATPDWERERDRSTVRMPPLHLFRNTRESGGGGGTETGSEPSTIATIRGMDKLEIFFKYTAMRADLERAELEREALMDALQESRVALGDSRLQRDRLDDELRQERQVTKQLKKVLAADVEARLETWESATRARQVWERRARDAMEELDRVKAERDELHRLGESGRANGWL